MAIRISPSPLGTGGAMRRRGYGLPRSLRSLAMTAVDGGWFRFTEVHRVSRRISNSPRRPGRTTNRLKQTKRPEITTSLRGLSGPWQSVPLRHFRAARPLLGPERCGLPRSLRSLAMTEVDGVWFRFTEVHRVSRRISHSPRRPGRMTNRLKQKHRQSLPLWGRWPSIARSDEVLSQCEFAQVYQQKLLPAAPHPAPLGPPSPKGRAYIFRR